MERIKDLLFDLSDILISLVIVAAIFFIVSWKLSETMPLSFALFQAPQVSSPKIADSQTVTAAPTVSEVAMTAEPVTNAQSQDAQEATEETPSTSIDAVPEPTKANIPVTNAPIKRITIDIPAGSTGDAIAKILKSSGLIEDISAFNRTVETLKLGNKLRAGSFTLSTDMSLEILARRIAGYKN